MPSPGPFSPRPRLTAIHSAVVGAVVCGIALGGLAACDSAVEPEDAIRVNTQVSRTSIGVNDAVTVEVTAVNHGNKVVAVRMFGCPDFVIRNGSQEILPEMVCSMGGSVPVNIRPGDSATVKSDWGGPPQRSWARQVGIGTYSLVGRVGVSSGTVYGSPVTVQVVP